MTAGKAMAAVEKAAFQLLDEGVAGAVVYQDVPEDQPLPVVIIGDVDAERSGGKADPDYTVTITVMTLIGLGERLPGFLLQDEIEAAVDGRSSTVDGWQIEFAHRSAELVLADDGSGYVGASRITAEASPTD